MERTTLNLRTCFVAAALVLMAFALAAIAVLMTPAQAQAASTKTVWVIVSKTETETEENTTEEGSYKSVAESKTKYSYNKSGLLTKMSRSGVNQSPYIESWKYDTKGNYKQWVKKLKIDTWDTHKFELKFDKKKRVKSIDGARVYYNSKGRCKKYSEYGISISYTSKGLIKKLGNQNATTKITRDSKGSITKVNYKSTAYDASSAYAVENKYKSGRLSNWSASRTDVDYGPNYISVTEGTLKWKRVSVPKGLVTKVKAQQRWIVDNLTAGVSADVPLILYNK